MGKIDDEVKQKLLNSLAEEPTMVISTAYAYAKNYVMYGEDITKAWTTAVQQASIIEKVKIKSKAEAYDYFKKDYEKCLKADLIAMLTELKTEIAIMSDSVVEGRTVTITSWIGMQKRICKLIQSKIDNLKENENGDNTRADR